MRESKKTRSKTPPKKTGLFFKKPEGEGFFQSNSHSAFFSPAENKPATIQTKLSVGEPNDMYEKEADSMAKKVVQQKPIFESKRDTVENTIQPKADTGGATASPELEGQLAGAAGSGAALSPGVRDKMESSFGEDFSNVRVHNSSGDAQMSSSLGAQAFTYGSDIYFNEGKYDESSSEGQGLIAHELTHVVQQRTGTLAAKSIQRQAAPMPTPASAPAPATAPGPSPTPATAPPGSASATAVPPVLFALDMSKTPNATYFSVTLPGHQLSVIATYLYGNPGAAEDLKKANPGIGDHVPGGTSLLPTGAAMAPDALKIFEQSRKTGGVLRTIGIPANSDKPPMVYTVNAPASGTMQVTEQQMSSLLYGALIWMGRQANYYSELLQGALEVRNDYMENRGSVVGSISDWRGDVSPPSKSLWQNPIDQASEITWDVMDWNGGMVGMSANMDLDRLMVGKVFAQKDVKTLQDKVKRNLPQLQQVAEAEHTAHVEFHKFIEGTIKGAGKTADNLEFVRNASFGMVAGLAAAVAAPAVFAAAVGVAGTGLVGTAVAGTATVVVGAGIGAVTQGTLNTVLPGEDENLSGWDRFKKGAKQGAVSGGIGAAGALLAPGVSGAIGNRLYGEAARTAAQQTFVNVLTGAAIGLPSGFTGAAINNFSDWQSGKMTFWQYIESCTISGGIGAVAGGAFGFLKIDGLYRSGGQPFNPFSGEPVMPRFMLEGPWSPIQRGWDPPPEFNALAANELPPNLPDGYMWMRLNDVWEPINTRGPFGEPFVFRPYTDANGRLSYNLLQGDELLSTYAYTRPRGATYQGPRADPIGTNDFEDANGFRWVHGHNVDHADTPQGPGTINSTTDPANYTPENPEWGLGPRRTLVGYARQAGGSYRQMNIYGNPPPVTANGTPIPDSVIFVVYDAAGNPAGAWQVPFNQQIPQDIGGFLAGGFGIPVNTLPVGLQTNVPTTINAGAAVGGAFGNNDENE